MTYSEKLRDPRWQKKRLEILNRHQFSCTLCGDQETELHIHHKSYAMGAEPWEYEDDNLTSLCRYCHFITENLGSLPLIVAKRVFGDDVHFFVIHANPLKSITVFRVSVNNPEHIITIKEQTLDEMKSLFQDVDKLIAYGKTGENRT